MRFFAFFLLTFFALWSYSAAETDEAPTKLNDGWPVAAPSEVGLDPKALTELVEVIEAGVNYPNVHAVLIERNGRLAFEHYWPGEDKLLGGELLGNVEHGPGTLHNVRSITKSVTSLLLGLALGQSANDTLQRPVSSLLPDRESNVSGMNDLTLHHVLTMTAGLDWNETIVPYNSRNDFYRLMTTSKPLDFVLSKQAVEAPGFRWNYSSGLTEIIAGVIEQLTGKPLTEFAEEVLFEPLGISEYEWQRPIAWQQDNFPSASAGLRLRARDLAKIGSVILHEGMWQGLQIVPRTWISSSTAPHVALGSWTYRYGYQWYSGQHYSGFRVIRAAGWGDQRIYILPEAGLAITIFAGNYDKGSRGIGDRILGRVVRALQ